MFLMSYRCLHCQPSLVPGIRRCRKLYKDDKKLLFIYEILFWDSVLFVDYKLIHLVGVVIR